MDMDRLREALEHAEQIERENRATGTPESKAYDAGRVDGLREAYQIVMDETVNTLR